MKSAPLLTLIVAASCLFAPRASAEGATHDEGHRWAVSAAAYTFFLPDHGDYVQPVIAVDRDAVHLESRYNYEAAPTGSAWVGYNLSGGEELTWSLTPIVGAIFGDRRGLAPGYEGTLGYWRVALDSESEYVFDFADASAGFLYNWTELALSPVEWLRLGAVVQRTRAYQTEREIQRGLLLGVSNELAGLTLYAFNPGEAEAAVWVVALELGLEP